VQDDDDQEVLRVLEEVHRRLDELADMDGLHLASAAEGEVRGELDDRNDVYDILALRRSPSRAPEATSC
jgi:hypothetical protein